MNKSSFIMMALVIIGAGASSVSCAEKLWLSLLGVKSVLR